MNTKIEQQKGHVYSHKVSTEVTLPRSTGLHSFDHRFEKEFPYPMVVEHVASHYKGTTKGHTADVEILETVPTIHTRRGADDNEQCLVSVACAYRLKGGKRDGSRRSSADLKFEHQVLYREADEISLNVTG